MRQPGRLLVAVSFCCELASVLPVTAQAPDYDIVYVRWPRRGAHELVYLPQGEDPYRLEPGASLVLLHPDGTQRVLVDCKKCCVQDPMVSFDGEWVYYTKAPDATDLRHASYLYKMRIGGADADFKEIRLTFDDGFDGWRHKGNDDSSDDLGQYFGIRDMGPTPLPGGGIAFTSNRHAAIAFRQGSAFTVTDASMFSVMQLYVMDDHDGRLVSAEMSNLRQVGFGNLHMVLHPFVLRDGRLLFSNWDDGSGKFLYAMTTLYAIRPDGSGLEAITEPHDHHKNVDHFATQLSDGAIVVGQYYPSFNFGFGHLCRFPIDMAAPAYTRAPADARNTYNGLDVSYRNFDRKGWESLTPHTSPEDCTAPGLSGKYAMPAAAPGGSCLVAYSPGGVNFNTTCTGDDPAVLDSGIYWIPDAEKNVVTNPKDRRQLIEILNDPDWNEIWPRPVVPYEEIHGLKEPKRLAPVTAAKPADDRLEPATPFALVGTSSLYNRESAPIDGDPFRPTPGRETHQGAWLIQGTDAGVVRNSDIQAVRIIGVVPKPFRRLISKFGATADEHAAIVDLLPDDREDFIVDGYAAVHGERWKILAEIPVRKLDASGNTVRDSKGDPDTSFLVKIPADTPFFYQGLDRNGMTLFSEMTWRSAVPGEIRNDCGGCHAHSIPHVDFADTAAGRGDAIRAAGIAASDPMIAGGVWDATERTPLLELHQGGNPVARAGEHGLLGVEFHRDIEPIFKRRCVSCHSTRGNRSGTDLAFDGKTSTDDAHFRLVKDFEGKFGGTPPGGSYIYPQLSRYVRAQQARQSLLVWKLFGARLDGRANGDRSDDLDFEPHRLSHGATLEEMQAIARWIDLGCPIDFESKVHAGYRYTDDNSLPVISVASPARGPNTDGVDFDDVVRLGATDAESEIDWSTLEIALDRDLTDGVDPKPLSLASLVRGAGSSVVALPLPRDLPRDRSMLLVVTVRDQAGNANRDARRFSISGGGGGDPDGGIDPPPPSPSPGSKGGGGGGGGGGCSAAGSGRSTGWVTLVVACFALAAARRMRRKSA